MVRWHHRQVENLIHQRDIAMAYITEIFEWEGDETQPFGTFNWRTKQFNMDNRMRFGYGRIYFDEGDFDAYNAALAAYNEQVNQNLGYLSGGYVMYVNAPHQGWPIGGLPLAGSVIRDPGSAPSYTGTKTLTLHTYADEVLQSSVQIFDENPFRVDAQLRSNRWSFEVEGNVEAVKRMEFAPSVRELKTPPQQGGQ